MWAVDVASRDFRRRIQSQLGQNVVRVQPPLLMIVKLLIELLIAKPLPPRNDIGDNGQAEKYFKNPSKTITLSITKKLWSLVE